MTGITVDDFEAERSRLVGLAYRMTGSVVDAEDIVQETWLRATTASDVDRPPAWLTTVATRLAIDRLRSASRRRERYVGPWLPEPILTDPDPASVVERGESLTLSFLHVLDRLEPVERAVFLLRDVFDVDYHEVAAVVDRTEANCRQIARRARDRVRSERPRFHVDPSRRRALLDSFLTAVLSGDCDALSDLLAEDVVLVSDGGPTRHAARRPVVGPHRVARFMVNLAKRFPDVRIELAEVNAAPALLAFLPDGELRLVNVVEFDGDRLRRIESISAPDKLARFAASLPRSTTADPSVVDR